MATAAAAIIAKARRRIIEHLMGANAVSPDQAVDYSPTSLAQARQFERLRNAGVVSEAAEGRYWIDVPAYSDWASRRRRRIATLLIALVVLALIAALLTVTMGRSPS